MQWVVNRTASLVRIRCHNHLKQEMYYGEEKVSYTTLKKRIEEHIDFYNNERIKTKLSGLSPVAYRKQDTQLAA